MVSALSDGARVLIVTPPPGNRGGVAHYYRVLRDHLPDDVRYFSRGGTGDETKLGGVFRLAADLRRFGRELDESDASVVVLNPSFGYKSLLRDQLFLRRAKRSGRSVVVFFRGWSRSCERVVRRRFASWFAKAYFPADLVIVLARDFETSLREMGYGGDIVVETTAVDDSAFAPVAESTRPEGCNALFLSRVERAKGIYEAIEAFRVVAKERPEVTLSVAGGGGELENARALVAKESISGVHFLGYVRDEAKDAAYRAADVYLFPTFHGEGMPNSLLEAMAYGLPVITRPVGGVRDFFEDGKMGFSTDSRDPARFAELLATLVDDPKKRQEMSIYNRTYAERRFKASRVASRLSALYGRFL